MPASCAASARARAPSLNASISVGSLRVAGERVQDEDAELPAGAEHAVQPASALLEVERRVPAHGHAGKTVGVEQPPGRLDLLGPEPVGVEVLEEALHRTDLDVDEPRLGEPAKRLVERVGLEADRRSRLDPAHKPLLSGGSSSPHTSRWKSTKPSG